MIDLLSAIGSIWDGERAWGLNSRMVPTAPHKTITLHAGRAQICFMRRETIQPPMAKPNLFGSLPRCNVPRLGKPCGLLPAKDSWRPHDGGLVRRGYFLGLIARGPASAAVIIVELV